MDKILPSELPYVIGVIAIVIALFWLVGRLADRGTLAGPRPVWLDALLALLLATHSVDDVFRHRWVFAILTGLGALVAVWNGAQKWRRRQRD